MSKRETSRVNGLLLADITAREQLESLKDYIAKLEERIKALEEKLGENNGQEGNNG